MVTKITIYLQSECIEKYQFKLFSNYDRELDFDIRLGYVIFYCKLRWICYKHSNDAAQQVETLGMATIFVM